MQAFSCPLTHLSFQNSEGDLRRYVESEAIPDDDEAGIQADQLSEMVCALTATSLHAKYSLPHQMAR